MALTLRKVLVTDGIHPDCAALLREGGLEVTQVGKLTPSELVKQLEGYDTLLVRSATKVTSAVLEACPELKLIGRAGTGTDNIDSQAATRHGVLVINTPGGNTLSAAEHTCVMIAALSRNLAAACQSIKDGKWERSKFLGSELSGKTLAVLGLGRIGREVASRMRAFGMKIIGYDPIITAEAAQQFHVEKRELEDIWPDADYVTVHTPLLPQTTNLVNAEALSRCKPGVRIINVARGGIVDEAALLASLEAGHCGGAGLDVFCQEPPTDWRLVQHPAVIATPHLGANTKEAQLRVARDLAEQIVTATQGGDLVGLVNATNLSAALSPASRPWVELGQALGQLTSQLANLRSGPRPLQLEVEIIGADMKPMQSLLSTSVLLGLMAGTTPNGVNLVNAPLAAREAGVAVTHRFTEAEGRGELAVRATAEGVEHSVVGSLHGGRPTLLEMDGARFESGVTIGGHMLFFQGDGDSQTVMSLITSLVAAHAQIVTVMTSDVNSRGPILAVRLQEPTPAPERLQSDHAKFLLEASF